MLVGTVAGGYLAQATNLAVPYIVRAGILGVTLLVAMVTMRDIGFTPTRSTDIRAEVKATINGAIDAGWRNPPVRWLMLSSPFISGVEFLCLLRDAAVPARAVRRSVRLRNRRSGGGSSGRRPNPRAASWCPWVRKLFQTSHPAASGRHGSQRCVHRAGGTRSQLLRRPGLLRLVGAVVCSEHSGPAGVRQRLHSLRPAGHRAVVRLLAWLGRGSRHTTRPGPGGRRPGISRLVRRERRDLCLVDSVHVAGQARGRSRRLCRHRGVKAFDPKTAH